MSKRLSPKRAAQHAIFKAKQLAQKAELDAIWSASRHKCAECGKSVLRTGAPNPHISGYVKDGRILCGDHFFPPGAIHEPPDPNDVIRASNEVLYGRIH